jgi:hypothetical protein
MHAGVEKTDGRGVSGEEGGALMARVGMKVGWENPEPTVIV